VPDTLDAQSLVRDALERRFTLAQLDDLYVDHVLEHTHGNKVQAARILGINRRTLYRRGDRRNERGECDSGEEAAPESEATTRGSR
jgi:DNA-binding NtrC family response regulator